jgi:hypothetical protein
MTKQKTTDTILCGGCVSSAKNYFRCSKTLGLQAHTIE